MPYIYKVTNIVNNKVYIGQTVKNISTRLGEHIRGAQYASEGKRKSFPHFYRAIIKYGPENFTVTLLEECKKEDLDEREIYWIDRFNSYQHGYNSTLGGQNNCGQPGWAVLQYSIEGQYLQTFQNAQEAADAINVVASSIRSACNQERAYSGQYQWRWYVDNFPQQIEAVAKPYRGYPRSVPVLQYSIEGQYLQTFQSAREAGDAIGVTASSIRRACNQQGAYSGQYQWRWYVDNFPQQIESVAKRYQNRWSNVRQIKQYSLNGDFIREFESIREASNLCHISYEGVRKVLTGKGKTSGGYQWRYSEDDAPASLRKEPKKEYKKKRTDRPVRQYDKNYCLVKKFNTLREAAQELNTRTSLIADACDKKLQTTSHYIWEWDDI